MPTSTFGGGQQSKKAVEMGPPGAGQTNADRPADGVDTIIDGVPETTVS